MLAVKDGAGRTLIHNACFFGCFEIVNKLIDISIKFNSRIDSKDRQGNTPLDLACIRGFSEFANEVSSYAFQDKDASTVQITRRAFCAIKLLRARDQDGKKMINLQTIRFRTNKVNTPLHWAMYWKDVHLAEILFLENPEMILCENSDGKLPTDLIFYPYPDNRFEESVEENQRVVFKLLNSYAIDFLLEAEPYRDFTNYYEKKGVNKITNLISIAAPLISPSKIALDDQEEQQISFGTFEKSAPNPKIEEGEEYDDRYLESEESVGMLNVPQTKRLRISKYPVDERTSIINKDEINIRTDESFGINQVKRTKVLHLPKRRSTPPKNAQKTQESSLSGDSDVDKIEEQNAQQKIRQNCERLMHKSILPIRMPTMQMGFERSVMVSAVSPRYQRVQPENILKKRTYEMSFSNLNLHASKEISTGTKMKHALKSVMLDRTNKLILEFKRAVMYLIDDCVEKLITKHHSHLQYAVVAPTHSSPVSWFIARMHRICAYLALISDIENLKLFFKRHGLSPFYPCIEGYSYIHIACMNQSFDFLLKLSSMSYITASFPPKRIELKDALEIPSLKNLDTPAHLTAKFGDIRCFRFLKKKGVNLEIRNMRGWAPLQLIPETSIAFLVEKKQLEIVNVKRFLTSSKNDKFNGLLCSQERLKGYDIPFLYCIISKAGGDVFGSILRGIRSHFGAGFIFKTVKGYEEDYEIHLIGLGKDLIYELAETLKEPAYDMFIGYHTTFTKLFSRNYEPLRETQLQGFLDRLFNNEFDLFRMQEEGLVIDHFPVHHFAEKYKIIEFWQRNFFTTFFSPLNRRTNLKNFRPFTQIAFYHGVQVGFLFGFITTYAAWLLPLAVFNGLIHLVSWIFYRDIRSPPTLAVCIANGIWSTIFYIGWKRREKELSMVFGEHGTSNLEKVRPGYQGEYTVDPVTREVTKRDSFPTKKRRIIVDVLLFGIGFALVVLATSVARYYNQLIKRRRENGEIDIVWANSYM